MSRDNSRDVNRRFRAAGKRTQKMSRDGLVEYNLATGEQTRASRREQDFNFRENQSDIDLRRHSPSAVHEQTSAPSQIAQRHAVERAFSGKSSLNTSRNETQSEQVPDTADTSRLDTNPALKKNGVNQSRNGTQMEQSHDTLNTSRIGTQMEQSRDTLNTSRNGTQFQSERRTVNYEPESSHNTPKSGEQMKNRLTDAEHIGLREKTRKQQAKTLFSDKLHFTGEEMKQEQVCAVHEKAAAGTVESQLKRSQRLVDKAKSKKNLPAQTRGVSALSTASAAAGLTGCFIGQGGETDDNAGLHSSKLIFESGRTVYRLHRTAARTGGKMSGTDARLQKMKLEQYRKRMAGARAARNTGGRAAAGKAAGGKAGTIIGKGGSKTVGVLAKHPATWIVLLVLLVLILFVALLNSGMLGGGDLLGSVVLSSYLADDADIDDAELIYTEWETDLALRIGNIEQEYPDYDEYRYTIDDIGHNPYYLMAYLSAVYQDFTYGEVLGVLQSLFDQQYILTIKEIVEVRYRTEYYRDPFTGATHSYVVAYNWYILHTTLVNKPLSELLPPKMNEEQLEIYGVLLETHGNRQYLSNVLEFPWLAMVSNTYGWRVHPVTGLKQYHTGVDIALASGTPIYAGHDGKVSRVSYDADGYGHYMELSDEKGLRSLYAHCDSILVSSGQEVKKGDLIALSGNSGRSTGPHLHLEVSKNGRTLNPLFFAETGGNQRNIQYGDAGAPMGDGTYEALIAEAEKYLGYPYVWGGSSPETSFDCSGFICWVYTQSGVYDLPRTTAQGIFNQSTPVSPEEARPGDLIFFTGTYDSIGPVSHVGIYVGGGKMLHCGNPIQYTSVNTNYWQSHFYAFGRLS